MFKISVIVPVYNTGKFLSRCLYTIINQTLKEIEIIIINDGSTDNSLEIIKKYEKSDNRIKVINKTNEGASKARNIGIELSKGEYLYFIDSDDYLDGDKVLEELYIRCKEDNLDILVFDYYCQYKDKKVYTKNLEIKESEIIDDKEKIFIDLIKEKYWGIVWNKLIKKEIFIKNNIWYPENIFIREDLVTVLKLIYFSKRIGKINKAFYNYVQHENQGTKKTHKEKHFNDWYNFNCEIEDFIEQHKDIFYLYKYMIEYKMKLYKEIFRSKYKKIEIRKEVIKALRKENKNLLYESLEYKKMNIKNKIKFYLYLKF